MKITHLKIENWRSVKDISIDFQDISVIIGQNNHGKSNILSAILFFFGKVKPDNQDISVGEKSSFIELEFNELDDSDKNTFKKYLDSNNKIKVRKTLNSDGKYSYHGYIEIPTEEWLNPDNVGDYTNREAASSIPLSEFIPKTGRITKDIVDEAQKQYIAKYQDKLKFSKVCESGPFLGLKNVAQGIFGDSFFIPAVKSASEELNLKGSSIFSELYSSVLNKLASTNKNYKDAKSQIETFVGVLNKTKIDGQKNNERPNELNEFENGIKKELGTWKASLEIEVIPPNIDDIFKVGTQIWINDGVRTDINRKGNGLQRALIFALIKSYSSLLKEETSNEEVVEGKTSKRKASNSSFFIIEEPELYLHPQAQRELFASLKFLSTKNNQIIITTHSSSFVDIENYKSISIVHKENVTIGTKARQCSDEIFNSIDDKKRVSLNYWINQDRSEIFFAKKVILVEGQTEKTVIPYLANELGVYRYDYSIIDCGSKDSIPLYVKLCNAFEIPYLAIYDRDHQSYKNPDGIASADRISEKIENQIDNSIGSTLIFENDIEEEIGITDKSNKNKPYIALNKISEEGFNLADSLKDKIISIFQ